MFENSVAPPPSVSFLLPHGDNLVVSFCNMASGDFMIRTSFLGAFIRSFSSVCPKSSLCLQIMTEWCEV